MHSQQRQGEKDLRHLSIQEATEASLFTVYFCLMSNAMTSEVPGQSTCPLWDAVDSLDDMVVPKELSWVPHPLTLLACRDLLKTSPELPDLGHG